MFPVGRGSHYKDKTMLSACEFAVCCSTLLLLLPDEEFCVITAQRDNNIWYLLRSVKVMFYTGSGMGKKKMRNKKSDFLQGKNIFPFHSFHLETREL